MTTPTMPILLPRRDVPKTPGMARRTEQGFYDRHGGPGPRLMHRVLATLA